MRLRFSNASVPVWCAPALVAIAALTLLLRQLDPGGDYPRQPEGPGLTMDEVFNVRQGVLLVAGLGELAGEKLGLRELFSDHRVSEQQHPLAGLHNPDHPPLGRLWLGCSHEIWRALAPPLGKDRAYVTACARSGSAVAFAALIVLVGSVAGRWYGRVGGLAAAVSLVLMPRLFGHAHLASLETLISLAYTAAVLSVACCWSGEKQPGAGCAAWTGGLLGVALLTKVQAVLVPVPVVLWAVLHRRWKAVLPLAVWTGVAVAMFFVLWPWLWSDPIANVRAYLGRTTNRVPLYTWYFGTRYVDVQTPWHYPAVLFLTTVPVGLHVLGFLGVFTGPGRTWKQPREQLVLACTFFPLLVFSLPGVAVYDGARLFLVVFPLWAVFVGRGCATALAALRQRWSRPTAAFALSILLAAQGIGLVCFAPVYLSYYNGLIGGLRGAAELGMERNYWGDASTRSLLQSVVQRVPRGARVDVVPVLHQFQLDEMLAQSPILRGHEVRLRPFIHSQSDQARYVLVLRREADLALPVRERLSRSLVLAETTRQGVQLAALYELLLEDRTPPPGKRASPASGGLSAPQGRTIVQ